jgi:hypothetical protein
MSNFFTPKLVFLCPPSFGKYWREQKGLGDLIVNDSQIHLRVDRSDYGYSTEGEKNVYSDYWDGVRVETGFQRLGFKATVKDPRERLEIMMRRLARPSDLGRHVLVTCYDFHKRLTEEDDDRGYRIRTGIMNVSGSGSGSLSQGYVRCDGSEVAPRNRQYYTEGFSIEFLEKDKDSYNFGG